ncbi:MAG: hypothetical protein ACRCS8_05750 [Brevinema sp.]
MKYVYLILLSALSVLPTYAQVKFLGEFRSDLVVAGGNGTDPEVQNKSSLIMNVNYKSEDWSFFSDLRVNLWYGYGDNTLLQPNGFLFLENQSGKHLTALDLDLNRLFVKAYAGTSIFTIGRSYVTFGQTVLFNTLEWSKNFSLFDIDAPKPALNMLNWDIGIGSYGKFSAMVAGDDAWEDILGATSLILGIPGFEFGFVYQYKGLDKSILGTYFKADIFITVFGSYAAHLNNVLDGNFQSDHEFSIGADYSFPIGLSRMLLQQIFYIHALGEKGSAELLLKEFGDFYFRGFAYSYSSISVQIDQFSNVGVDVLANMLDGSGMVLPKSSFTLLDGLTLDMMLGINFGKRGTEFGYNPGQPALAFLTRLSAKF